MLVKQAGGFRGLAVEGSPFLGGRALWPGSSPRGMGTLAGSSTQGRRAMWSGSSLEWVRATEEDSALLGVRVPEGSG